MEDNESSCGEQRAAKDLRTREWHVAVAVKRRQRQSISVRSARSSDQTFNNKATRGAFASGDRGSAPGVLGAACTSIGRSRTKGLHQQHKAPPDAQTGQSMQACLRRVVLTDHEARSHTHQGIAAGVRALGLGLTGVSRLQSYGGKARARGKDAEKLRPSCPDSLRLHGPQCTISASRWPSHRVHQEA